MFLTVPAALVESALHCGGHAHEDAGAGLPVAGVARRCGRKVNRACRFASRVPCSVGRRKKPLHRRMPERRQIGGPGAAVANGAAVTDGGCGEWRPWRMARLRRAAWEGTAIGQPAQKASSGGQLRRPAQAVNSGDQPRRPVQAICKVSSSSSGYSSRLARRRSEPEARMSFH